MNAGNPQVLALKSDVALAAQSQPELVEKSNFSDGGRYHSISY